VVVKKDQGRVPYERDKVRQGLKRATWKRRIREQEIEDFLDELECELADGLSKEVTTVQIGSRVLRFLRETDQVAYVRFQSVYGDFQSVDEFRRLLTQLDGES